MDEIDEHPSPWLPVKLRQFAALTDERMGRAGARVYPASFPDRSPSGWLPEGSTALSWPPPNSWGQREGLATTSSLGLDNAPYYY